MIGNYGMSPTYTTPMNAGYIVPRRRLMPQAFAMSQGTPTVFAPDPYTDYAADAWAVDGTTNTLWDTVDIGAPGEVGTALTPVQPSEGGTVRPGPRHADSNAGMGRTLVLGALAVGAGYLIYRALRKR